MKIFQENPNLFKIRQYQALYW